MYLVYQRCGDTLVVAERELAERVSAIRVACEDATTWADLVERLPPGEWARLADQAVAPLPAGSQPFDPDDLPGYADGDYPRWLAGEMVHLLDPGLVERHGGEVEESVFNGPSVWLGWDRAEAVVAELRSRGHTVTHRPELRLE